MRKMGLFLLKLPISLVTFICGYFLLNIRNREKGLAEKGDKE